jgi:unsaturated rhamnogalacturonyl hydrolase
MQMNTKYLKKSALIFGAVGILLFCLVFTAEGAFPTKQDVIDTMRLVNDYWISSHADPGDNQWARATYFEGNMAFYTVYPDPRYYNYALAWAGLHDWTLSGGDTTRIADNQCAGQTYLELYGYDPQPYKIAHIQASIDNMVDDNTDTDWWWIDALQMAMPVFAQLGELHSDTAYFDKMWTLYHHTKYERGGNGLYSDNGANAYGDYLWWRDANFDPPVMSPGGNMVYWSRGNGWVIAAHARTLQHLPTADPHYGEYVQTFRDMAAALAARQRSDGFWNPNLDDPDHCGGKETSGTAFFAYAMAWGINNGFLDDITYRPIVEKAWDGMVRDAVHPDGKLGYVQASADDPCDHFPVGYEDTTDFGVGAFLLAGSEVAQMADGPWPTPHAWYSSPDWTAVHDLEPGNTGRLVVTFAVTPLDAPTDGLVGYAGSETTVDEFTDMSVIVRMYSNGRFEAIDGDGYDADAVVPYSVGTVYRIKIGIDIDGKTFDVWVTPNGGAETRIAHEYAFRSAAPAMTDLGKVVLKTDPTYDAFMLEDHTVKTTCLSDYDYDDDVDGSDLANYIIAMNPGAGLAALAGNFGSDDCL